MSKNFWDNLPKPIIALAPMEGWTDSAMRRITKKVAPDVLTYTEFTSAEGLYHNPVKIKERFQFQPEEQPLIAQIYGKTVEAFVNATKMCEDMGFAGIDINMGCPAKKVVRSEQGIALRRKPELAYRLIESVAKNTSLPVSVKTRLGWNDASDLIEFGKGAQNAGADAIAIHARTYQEPYGVKPHYNPLYELKKEISIPVIGNGGITSLEKGFEYMQNLDGFMIGQAAMGNPWIFANEKPPIEKQIPIIKLHVEYLLEIYPEKTALLHSRKHLLSYVKGFDGAAEKRKRLAQTKSKKEIFDILDEIKKAVQA